jgi:hypothetical protein
MKLSRLRLPMNLLPQFPKSLRTWAFGSALILLCTTSIAGSTPSLEDADFGKGKFARMHMLLEKTILLVDVATIDVRVAPSTEAALEKAARGRAYNSALEEDLAKIMFGAPSAMVQIKFVREITLEQFVGGVRESLDEAHHAGKIDAALRQRVSAGLPEWFKAMKESGFRDGDRVIYKIGPNHLRTVVVRKNGQVMVDRTIDGADKRMILLGSYFAAKTSYREPLLRSLGK